jgi:hypothetical protein
VRIFVSYRRDDASPWAGRLHDSLVTRFGVRNVFQDVVDIFPGEDFTSAIDRALADSDAALVVIGPQWLTATGGGGIRRLDEPFDLVRSEVEAALGRDLRVIPVLVGGASMPTEAELPAGLEPLARRQGVALRDVTWQQDVAALARTLTDEPTTHRRVLTVVTAIALLAVVAAIVGSRLLHGTGHSANGDRFPTCPTATSKWTSLPLPATDPAHLVGKSGAWAITPTAAVETSEPDGFRVILTVRATNESTDTHYQVRAFYELVVNGVQFQPTCFGVVAGNDPLGPNSTDVVLVGFEPTADPTIGPLALDLDVDGGRARLELR